MYGDSIGAVSATYVLSYFGENITNGSVSVTAVSATIDLPAVDSDVNVYVTAMNVFGTGGDSGILMDEISESHTYITTYIVQYIFTYIYAYTYVRMYVSVLEITVDHWPFSDQFQHLANQNPFWSAKIPVHFQWGQQLVP